MHTQTSLEILLDGVLTLMLWEADERPEDWAKTFQNDSITRRVKTYYHERLGGNWNLDTSPPLKGWIDRIARPRNKVIHTGYQPGKDEAQQAIDAVTALEKFVKTRLAVSRARWPKAALIVLARPGLERLGAWDKRMRNLEARLDNPDEPDWLASYRQWRTSLESAGFKDDSS